MRAATAQEAGSAARHGGVALDREQQQQQQQRSSERTLGKRKLTGEVAAAEKLRLEKQKVLREEAKAAMAASGGATGAAAVLV